MGTTCAGCSMSVRAVAAIALALSTTAPAAAARKQIYVPRATGVLHRAVPKAIRGNLTRKLPFRPRTARGRGYEPMYGGVGSAVGFRPGPYADDDLGAPALPPVTWRRAGGVRETMTIDLLTRSNGYAYGYPFP